MPDKSFADLLAEVGIQPSAATQYAQSLQRPVPYRNYTPPRPLPRQMRPADVRAYDDNAGVAQQALGEMRRDRMTGQDAMLREAQGPASNQFADAGMVALETTGVPALRRSYDAFEAGDPRQGIYEGIWGGLGLAGTLGAIPGARRGAPRLPTREPVLPQMREPPAPPPGSVLPVRPLQPFRQSLIGGADDLTGASRGVFSEGPPDGMPRRAPDAGIGRAGQRVTLDVNSPNERSYNSPNTSVIIERQPGDDAFSVSWGLRGRQPQAMVERAGIEREGIEAAIQAIRLDAQANPGAAYQFQGTHRPLIRRYRRMAEQAANAAGFTVTERNGSLVVRRQSPDGGASGARQTYSLTAEAPGSKRHNFQRDGAEDYIAILPIDSQTKRIVDLSQADTWRINDAYIPEELRGQGRGVELYEALIERARASGARVLSSDSSVSDSAQRVWQSLIRRGHPITAREGVNGTTVYELRLTDAPTAGPPDTAKSYRPGPPKGGFFFSRRR